MIGPGARKALSGGHVNRERLWAGNIMHDGQRILQLTPSHDTGHGTGEKKRRKNFHCRKNCTTKLPLTHNTLGHRDASRDTRDGQRGDRSHGQ